MRKNKCISLFLLLLFGVGAFAQQITVNGTVTDASDTGNLVGVSVVVKGTSQGTVTDLDGNYSLSVSPGATLVFRYVGYAAQEIAVKNRTVIHVALQSDEKALDEVVVVGVSMKKSDLTGAVGSVSGAVLAEKPVTSINEALQGRVAGVLISNAAKPGDDASIRIRGINTIDGSTDPIYVVDGLVMDNFGRGFSSINLNDVASIEVLKDASSTALYGSRASNGVILVTTKKGKAGEGKITYDGWFGVQSYAKLPKTMNSKQLFDLSRDAAMNSFDALHPN
ncbi:MAG: TonB-dependent receptor plug domain-containing protein, partial [Bacteroidales bacterium]|nr:TonB-dependent receptor plug domain-containing protein [Bacteroidales bacterium]